MNATSGLWVSGFRPFFLVGATYGPLVLVLALGARLVGGDVLGLDHAHELLYGFTSATVCGVLLTALGAAVAANLHGWRFAR